MPATADARARLSAVARRAVGARDWPTVRHCASELLKLDRNGAEGWFLSGLSQKAAGDFSAAAKSLSRAVHYDSGRYDAAVELAAILAKNLRNADAKEVETYHGCVCFPSSFMSPTALLRFAMRVCPVACC